MRFSIRLDGFGKFSANVGGDAIVVHGKLLPLSLFGGTWEWSWIDGTPMSLRLDPVGIRKARCFLLTDGETVCSADIDSPFFDWREREWVWSYGDRQLSHRSVRRRMDSCKGMFGIARHVLKSDDGKTVAAWAAGRLHAFDGIIRRSIGNDLARIVFGVLLSMYVSEPGDTPAG